MPTVLCDYCKNEATLITGNALYDRKDLDHLLFWKCDACQAWVGCHPDTCVPFGSLAKLELRNARRSTHAVFDRLWKSGNMRRTAAYDWLAQAMQLPHHLRHIGMFDEATCVKAQKLCNTRMKT